MALTMPQAYAAPAGVARTKEVTARLARGGAGGAGALGEGGLEGFGDELPEVAGGGDGGGEAGIHGELLATSDGDVEPGDVDPGILDFGLAIFDWKGGGEGEQGLDVGNAEGLGGALAGEGGVTLFHG